MGSETCSSGSSNASVKNEDYEQGLLPDGQDCMECVTLVSVPDDQVITQGINHHCSISKASGNRIGDSVVDHGSSPPSRLVADLRDEIALLRHQLEMAKEAIRNNNNKFESKNTDGSRSVSHSLFLIYYCMLGSSSCARKNYMNVLDFSVQVSL